MTSVYLTAVVHEADSDVDRVEKMSKSSDDEVKGISPLPSHVPKNKISKTYCDFKFIVGILTTFPKCNFESEFPELLSHEFICNH